MDNKDTIACRLSYLFLRKIPSLRAHILLMQTCIEAMSDRLDQSEARLTTIEAHIAAQAANGETSANGRRFGDAMRDHLDEECDRVFELVDRLVELVDVLDDFFLDVQGEE